MLGLNRNTTLFNVFHTKLPFFRARPVSTKSYLIIL
jgi:hypothetical protein